MKKLLLLGFILIPSLVRADFTQDQYIPRSSYTEVASPGITMFSSGSVRFVGINISSPAPNSYIAIFRSTSPVFITISDTQTLISTDYFTSNNGPVAIPLYDMKNDSYTYINKVGTAKITYFIRCRDTLPNRQGVCPGLTGY